MTIMFFQFQAGAHTFLPTFDRDPKCPDNIERHCQRVMSVVGGSIELIDDHKSLWKHLISLGREHFGKIRECIFASIAGGSTERSGCSPSSINFLSSKINGNITSKKCFLQFKIVIITKKILWISSLRSIQFLSNYAFAK